MSDWDEYDSYWSDLYESDGGEYEYEEALELLPSGSKRTDVEEAIRLMRAAANGGCQLAQSWLDNCLYRYLDDDGNIKAKWRRKPSGRSEDPEGEFEIQKGDPPFTRSLKEMMKRMKEQKLAETPDESVVIHELGYYEELYLGVLERDRSSFNTLLDLANGKDHVACYYLGIFLEKMASNVISLMYARKWFRRGWKLGNGDCFNKYVDVDERISDINDKCPYCGSKLRTIPGQYGGHFRGCSRYPECDFTCRPELTQYDEVDGIIYPKMRVGNPIGKGYITEHDIFEDYVRFGFKK